MHNTREFLARLSHSVPPGHWKAAIDNVHLSVVEIEEMGVLVNHFELQIDREL